MPRFWPFRSVYNFGLTVIASCGIGFYGYGIYNQQNFSNPVVAQAVKILGKNQKVKQMIGYPLSYQASTKNKFNQKGNQLYFDFKVIGPRGSTQVQVTATKLMAKQVYQYDQQLQTIKNVQTKYEQLKQQLKKLQQSKSKSSTNFSLFGNKNKKSQNNLSKQEFDNKNQEYKKTQALLEQLIKQQKLRKNQYCIPQKQFYTQIVSQSGKNNQKVLPEQATLYKLEHIACQLPNKSRINVLNSGNTVKTQQYETKLSDNVNFTDYKKPYYGPLHQKLSINVAQLSDQEIQQYSKHKNNFMYQRYNQYRIIAFMCFVIGSGALFLYFSKNKTKNMSNSVLYQLVTTRVGKNPEINNLLKAKKLRQLDLDKNVGGGMKNNVFNCQIGVNNVTMGRIQIEGKHNPKQGTYDYKKFMFKYIENNEHREIDLLK